MGYAGSDWVAKNYKGTMSPLGITVADLLGDMYQGIYHIASGRAFDKVKWSDPDIIVVILPSHASQMANHDFNHLTRLVVLTHDRCLRVSIEPHGFRYLRLMFHPRNRGNDICREIPTLEDHVAKIRGKARMTDSASTLHSTQNQDNELQNRKLLQRQAKGI